MPTTNARPTCPNCDKDFASGRALCQHVLDKHRFHACLACGKWFGSAHALDEHDELMYCGPSVDDLKPPFRGAAGRWVPLLAFTPEKSFGVFWCPPCDKRWFSAHAYRSDPSEPNEQQCNDCLEYHPPVFMWVNEDSDGPIYVRRGKRPAHRAELCRRCQSGKRCTKA
jgi:hypothetical protein